MPPRICATAETTTQGRSLAAWSPALELEERTPATPCGQNDRDQHERQEHGRKPDRPGRDLTSEPPAGAGLDEARQHDHAERPGDEHQRQIDAVGGEEAVGLNAETKFARENDPEHSGGATDGRRRDSGQDPAANRPPTLRHTIP